MTLLNLFSRGPRARADTRGDGSVALIVFLLFGLVFAPVIGLHVALAAVEPGAAHAAPGIAAHDAATPAARRHR
jgi:hypothetical protein